MPTSSMSMASCVGKPSPYRLKKSWNPCRPSLLNSPENYFRRRGRRKRRKDCARKKQSRRWLCSTGTFSDKLHPWLPEECVCVSFYFLTLFLHTISTFTVCSLVFWLCGRSRLSVVKQLYRTQNILRKICVKRSLPNANCAQQSFYIHIHVVFQIHLVSAIEALLY